MEHNDQIPLAKATRQTAHDEKVDQCKALDVTTAVLWVIVPYSNLEFTKAALRHARLCSDLDVHVSLIDVQAVPFPSALDQPPINAEYSQSRLQKLFAECGLPGRAAVLYTRDWLEGFRQALNTQSLVVIATKRRWWPTREQKLARALSDDGHQVMLLFVR